MTIYFAGSEPDCVAGNFTVDTSGDYHNPDLSRLGLKVAGAQKVSVSLPAEIGAGSASGWWLHALLKRPVGDGDIAQADQFYVRDGAGNLAFSVASTRNATCANAFSVFTVYGASGASAGSANVYGLLCTATDAAFDVHCYTAAGAAKLDVYFGGAPIATASVSATANRGLATAVLGSFDQYGDRPCGWSEIIIADEDTRGYRVGTAYASADGTYTDGTGSYADIDEIATDGAAVILSAPGDKQSWSLTKHGTWPASGLRAIAVNGLVASSGVDDLQALLRIGGVDYTSADLGLAAAAQARSVVFDAHPATSGPWGDTDVETIEAGFAVV